MTLTRWLLPLLCSTAWACNATSNDDTGGSTPATCDVACQDAVIGYAIDETLWLIWNQNLAGQPSGAQSRTANCPLGGTAQISGTTGVASNGINTVHLTLVLSACENSNAAYTIALTGTLTWDGSFSATSPNAITFKSPALAIHGTVKRYDQPDVSESCAVSLTDIYNKNGSSTAVWLNGEICGRQISQ